MSSDSKSNQEPVAANEDKVEVKLDKFIENCFNSTYENYKKRVMQVKNITEDEYQQNED